MLKRRAADADAAGEQYRTAIGLERVRRGGNALGRQFVEAAASQSEQRVDGLLVAVRTQPRDAAAKALAPAVESAEPAVPRGDCCERVRVLQGLPTVGPLADALHVSEDGNCRIDVALQTVKIRQLTQQCILPLLVEAAVSPQNPH